MKKFKDKDGHWTFECFKEERPFIMDAAQYGHVREYTPIELILLEDGTKDNKESIILLSHNEVARCTIISQISVAMLNKGLEKIGYKLSKITEE